MAEEKKAECRPVSGSENGGAAGTSRTAHPPPPPQPVKFRVVRRRKFALALLFVQASFLVLFAAFVENHVGRGGLRGGDGDDVEGTREPPRTQALQLDNTTHQQQQQSPSTTPSIPPSPATPRRTEEEEEEEDKDHVMTVPQVPSIQIHRQVGGVPELVDEGLYPFVPVRDTFEPSSSGDGEVTEGAGAGAAPAVDIIPDKDEEDKVVVDVVAKKEEEGDDENEAPFKFSLNREHVYGTNHVRNFLHKHQPRDSELHDVFPLFQDVHVMIFVGFGFLMTFLKRYGYSAVGVNMLLGAVVIQWATLCQGFFHIHHGKIHVDITSLLNADFASATVLISFGALLGKTSPLQLLVMAIFEIAIFAANEFVGAHVFWSSDIGASVLVHVFGAYFGLMVSLVLNRRDIHQTNKEGAVYHSDVFAMIGTIFLWLFWPSFNAALAPGHAQHRVVINTYYSLAACCVTTFAISSLVDKHSRFNMVHVQNSTLAGGVAIGTAADLMIEPWGAMLVGTAAGVLSVLGYRFITPFMSKHLRIHDTCGVHNLHGMPGVFAGIVGAIMASLASEDEYGKGLYQQYPMRAPAANTTELVAIQSVLKDVEAGKGWSAHTQGAYQLAALCVTLGVACVGGLITGVILRLPFLDPLTTDQLFEDEDFWEVPEEEPLVALTTTPHGPGLKQQDSKV